jgi:hypothetical protein
LIELSPVNTVRELSKITGENWLYIAKIFRILTLPEPIKDFLRNNKNYPSIVKLFNLRRLRDIVRQGEERLQLGRFRELVEVLGRGCFEDSGLTTDAGYLKKHLLAKYKIILTKPYQ